MAKASVHFASLVHDDLQLDERKLSAATDAAFQAFTRELARRFPAVSECDLLLNVYIDPAGYWEDEKRRQAATDTGVMQGKLKPRPRWAIGRH